MIYIAVMVAGSLIMLSGVMFGNAMAVSQYKNQKLNIYVNNKKQEEQ